MKIAKMEIFDAVVVEDSRSRRTIKLKLKRFGIIY